MSEARIGEEQTRHEGAAEPGMEFPQAEPAAETMDVVEGEIGSAAFKDPADVEAQGRRAEEETLPEAQLDAGAADRPSGQA